jgi:hypothetical protein
MSQPQGYPQQQQPQKKSPQEQKQETEKVMKGVQDVVKALEQLDSDEQKKVLKVAQELLGDGGQFNPGGGNWPGGPPRGPMGR